MCSQITAKLKFSLVQEPEQNLSTIYNGFCGGLSVMLWENKATQRKLTLKGMLSRILKSMPVSESKENLSHSLTSDSTELRNMVNLFHVMEH